MEETATATAMGFRFQLEEEEEKVRFRREMGLRRRGGSCGEMREVERVRVLSASGIAMREGEMR